MEHYELHSIINPFEILVLTRKGVLKKLHCPFRVLCIRPVDHYGYNTVCYIEKVMEVEYNSICYIINGRLYPHHHFRIYTAF